MGKIMKVLQFVGGIFWLSCWVAWLLMLGIGTLAGYDVVGASVSFSEAFPMGLGLVFFGLLPLGGLFLATLSNVADSALDEYVETASKADPSAGLPYLGRRSDDCGRRY